MLPLPEGAQWCLQGLRDTAPTAAWQPFRRIPAPQWCMMSRQSLVWVELLDRGSHHNPRAGGCFMEVAGSLRGGPWTARPGCTPRVLAAAARRVNDASTAAARPALAPFIPWVIDDDPDDWHVLDLAVAVAVGEAAPPWVHLDQRVPLTAATDRTRSRVAACAVGRPGWQRRLRWRRDAHRLVARAVSTTVENGGQDRDRRLRQLLATAIQETRARRRLPPLDLPQLPARMCAVRVPVLTELVPLEGGDSLYLACTAVISGWPAWLQDNWATHRRELSGGAVAGEGSDRRRSASVGMRGETSRRPADPEGLSATTATTRPHQQSFRLKIFETGMRCQGSRAIASTYWHPWRCSVSIDNVDDGSHSPLPGAGGSRSVMTFGEAAPMPVDPACVSLGRLVARVEHQVSRQVASAAARENLSLNQWRVIALLGNGPGLSMTEIAEHLMMPPPTLTRIVDRLVDAAAVHRRVDEVDHRRVRVFLSAHGAELHARLGPEIARAEHDIVTKLGQQDARRLLLLLEQIANPPQATGGLATLHGPTPQVTSVTPDRTSTLDHPSPAPLPGAP